MTNDTVQGTPLKYRITTKSGSIYEVDEVQRLVRRVKAVGVHRITEAWKPYERHWLAIGSPLALVWGTGRDEFSPDDDGIPDETRTRYTHTSPVVTLEVIE